MDSEDSRHEWGRGAATQFATTHWSVVLAATDEESSAAQDALQQLCHAYWYPLYAYVRRRGHSPEDARDLTQKFFATLLEKKYLARADRQRGRFRTFLLTAINNFLHHEHERGSTLKRGGGCHFVSWEQTAAEGRYALESANTLSPERIFEKRWGGDAIGASAGTTAAGVRPGGSRGVVRPAQVPPVGGGRRDAVRAVGHAL